MILEKSFGRFSAETGLRGWLFPAMYLWWVHCMWTVE